MRRSPSLAAQRTTCWHGHPARSHSPVFRTSTNVEAIASLAADEFYSDQPELALVLFR